MLNKRTRKVMETVKVVIDEASMYDSLKDIDKLPKSVLHLTLGNDKGVGEQDSSPLASPSAIQILEDSSTSFQPDDHMERESSSRVKLNHPPDVIMGNMNELTLRKRIVDKYVAKFDSYSCYLSQVELAKVEDALQDESWVEAMPDELHQIHLSRRSIF